MLAKMFSKEWLWIAVGATAAWMMAAGIAAAQSKVPVQFAVQTTTASADSPVRTALYTAGDQQRVKTQPVWWGRRWGWGRPYAAYYGAPYYAYSYPAPYYAYRSAPVPYTTYYAPYTTYYGAPYGYYYPRPAYYYGPRWYYRW